MLLDHLRQHPELYAYPLETYVLPHFLQAQHSYGDLSKDDNFCRLWDTMRSSYVFRWKNGGRPVELPPDWRDVPRSAAGVFDRIMRRYAALEGKSRWAEKTPMHVLHIERLAGAFEGSTFIHMIRDGRDCAASNHRRWRQHPAGTMFRWKHAVSEGRRQGRAVGDRYLELRYEELTDSPTDYLKAACDFIGLEFDERICEARRAHRHIGMAVTRTIVRNPGGHASYFTAEQLRPLEAIAGRQLEELGYATQFSAGDEQPMLLRRLWWTIHDGFATTRRHFAKLLTTQKRMTIPLMWRRWKSILQNKLSNRRSRVK